MEAMRRKLAAQFDFAPGAANPRDVIEIADDSPSPSAQSVSSAAEDRSVISVSSDEEEPVKHRARRAVIESDSEDESDGSSPPSFPVPQLATAPEFGRQDGPAPSFPIPQPAPAPKVAPVSFNPPAPAGIPAWPLGRPKPDSAGSAGKPIFIPTTGMVPTEPPRASKPATFADGEEVFEETADIRDAFDPGKRAGDAEKELRDLLASNIGADDEDAEVDEEEAEVEGMPGVRLRAHQIQARRWMRERETGKKFGGILADDMGLGKTLETIVRIYEGRPKKSDKADGWSASTLVVAPLAVVGQWASEVQKFAPGLRVTEHHGPGRTSDPRDLQNYHVVVTSYQVLANEYKAHSGGGKNEGKKKGKAQKDDEDSDAFLDDSDDSNIGRSLPKKKTKSKAKAKTALLQVQWFRVVLDEAHNIKNRNTQSAQACCALESKYRWVLTGTPMQNSVEELFSLFKFLRIRPLNDWDEFNRTINKPVKSGKSVRAMKRLQVVLRAIMMRRLKTDVINGKPLVDLPPKEINVVPCEFDEDERRFYEAIEEKVRNTFSTIERAGEVMSSYTVILVLLLRLRQVCNHPLLVAKHFKIDTAALEARPAKNQSLEDDQEEELAGMFSKLGVEGEAKPIRKCTVCMEELNDGNSASPDNENCDACAKEIARQVRRKSMSTTNPDLPATSAKIRKILSLLLEIQGRGDGTEKTIIFSQFTSMLDIIQPFLKDEGIKYVRYDGSMSKPDRDDALKKIRTSERHHVILISFKAGSTGLNLTSCNNVILVDLWWNPALEDQAFDRAHRMGQERQVKIYKLTVPNTVEDRILGLQEKKRALAAAALSGNKLKLNKLAMDDLVALFRGGGHDTDEED